MEYRIFAKNDLRTMQCPYCHEYGTLTKIIPENIPKKISLFTSLRVFVFCRKCKDYFFIYKYRLSKTYKPALIRYLLLAILIAVIILLLFQKSKID